MALSLTTAIKDKVAYALGSSTYALASDTMQKNIDNCGASSLAVMEMESQWYNMLSAATNAPDAWESYYVADIIARVSKNTHPDRMAAYATDRQVERLRAHAYFARLSVTYSPGVTTDAFVYTVQTVRTYCINHCIRMNPELEPAIESIDSALDETLTFLWNKAKWGFRRRQVTFRVTRTDFTGGVWTNSTKIISGLSGLPTLAVGTRIYVKSLTSTTGTVRADEYTVSSNAATTITLNNSITSDGSDATAVVGFYFLVEISGLETGESFDSFSTNYLNGTGTGGNRTNGSRREIRWADGDSFAALRSSDMLSEGAPQAFRAVQVGPSSFGFLFWPLPDQSYDFRGEVIIRQPSAPSAASGTFSKFAAEFLPMIRRRTLANLLTNSGRHDEALERKVNDEIESMLPGYQEVGPVESRNEPVDVYHDIEDQQRGSMSIGGMI